MNNYRQISVQYRTEGALATGLDHVARPDGASTFILLSGLLLTALLLQSRIPSEVARTAAIGVGVSLVAAILADLRHGWQNLFRADVMAVCALYFLTFVEFLFPQPQFDIQLQNYNVVPAAVLCLWGFAGLAIGRHLRMPLPRGLQTLLSRPVPHRFLIMIFWSSFFLGTLHMLIAVGFNPVRMVELMLEARFSQPWARGRLGDWNALIYETGLLLYLVPPLAGLIFARRHEYPGVHVMLIVLGFLFILFQGFSTGTRNVFDSYLVTASVAYCYGLPRRRRREAIILGVLCFFALLLSTQMMLQFRRVGLRGYLQNGSPREIIETDRQFFVDHNLYVIAGLAREIPKTYDHLGFEVPYLALIHPIPRAIWPEKPEGMSVSVEKVMRLQNTGVGLAATFVGEAYLAGGTLAVFLAGCFFGMVARWWGQLASTFSSQFGIFIYASGFFAIVISMRSLLWFTTAILPPLAAITAGIINARRAQKNTLFPSGFCKTTISTLPRDVRYKLVKHC